MIDYFLLIEKLLFRKFAAGFEKIHNICKKSILY